MLDLVALRRALAALDEADGLDAAQDALVQFSDVLRLPILSWAPDVSQPFYDPHMDKFMRRQGWSNRVMELWWDRSVMLKVPLYIRCRTEALPFVTSQLNPLPDMPAEVREMTDALESLGVKSMITAPIHLPKGQVAMITWAGPLQPEESRQALKSAKAEILAAGQYFMRAVGNLPGDKSGHWLAGPKLTPREWECLRLTAQGHREAETAELLEVKRSTVRFHLRNVERKLGAATRTHAVAIAAQLGMLGPISS